MDGAVFIQWSWYHEHSKKDQIDIFGAKHDEMIILICSIKKKRIGLRMSKLPGLPLNANHRIYIVTHADGKSSSLGLCV